MDVSNKTLALFLIAAMVISIGGTLISLNNMNRLTTPGKIGLTGFATNETGNITLEISKIASIRFAQATLDWGSGYVDPSDGSNTCVMETNGSGWNNASCIDFSAVSSHLILENNGSLFVEVELEFSDNPTSLFGSNTNAILQYNVSNSESGSCAFVADIATAVGWNNTVTAYNPIVCTNLSYVDSKDTLAIEFKVGFNTSIQQKAYQLNITAFGTALAGQ